MVNGVSEKTERVSMNMIKEKKKAEQKGKGHACIETTISVTFS